MKVLALLGLLLPAAGFAQTYSCSGNATLSGEAITSLTVHDGRIYVNGKALRADGSVALGGRRYIVNVYPTFRSPIVRVAVEGTGEYYACQ